ncbi:hypothetical protein EV421DRAFT_1706830 [Armillaria borealis]|uniref:MPN domain-containing protein n=1 Tax=Armillaria borealis TaxID=47425 RepID=A0AA39JQW9_9AGAR|nr:hypothetical protein EV421DRAFT_1706830 [Armillaria borealis]
MSSTSPRYPPPGGCPPRPPTIDDLAARAVVSQDNRIPIKSLLKTADNWRNRGQTYEGQQDLQNAFVAYASAGKLALEIIVAHPDYDTALSKEQKSSLVKNGERILADLAGVKEKLLKQREEWDRKYGGAMQQPDGGHTPTPTSLSRQINSSQGGRTDAPRINLPQEQQRQWRDEEAMWRKQNEDINRQIAEERAAAGVPNGYSDRRTTAVMDAARQAAGVTPPAANGTSSQANNQEEKRRQQQEEMRIRSEQIAQRNEEKRQKQLQEMMQRQQQAERNAQNERRRIAENNAATYPPLPTTRGVSLSAPPAGPSRTSDIAADFSQLNMNDEPRMMPLESPTRYEGDSTDSEAPQQSSPLYPPPITTTSPAPVDGGPIQYPQLMTQHQKTQGYSPSLNSMFSSTKTPAVTSSILFEQGYPHRSQPLYPPNFYPHPSAQPPPPVDYPNPAQRHAHHHHSSRLHLSRSDSDRIPRSNSSSQDLKHVNMPRECLPRFIAIAKVNTMINRETCGLLLGKDKGHKFVVTTMLIPKQHSTSDTCTMDEEELVLRFTEERNLITLGWIHTHPTQTCFMSSVDLHTHSGFQRMLPESFAVVCAPRHNPNFGIFRLTDPPGLQTILTCTAREAFHPHPDQPIYTDADKGHVQMKEGMSLEIVDLR